MTLLTPKTSHCASGSEFAIAAVRDAFRGCDLRLAAEPEFVDRLPHEPAVRLGEVGVGVVREAAQAGLRHWLHQAAIAQIESERIEALAIARSISLKAGLPWPADREAA